MNAQLQNIFDLLEKQREHLILRVKGISSARLHFHPEGKWSIMEVLAHIITAEKISLQYVKKKIQGVHEVSDTGIWEDVKMQFLKVSQRLPGLKFRAPHVVVEHTRTYKDLQLLEEDWKKLRNEWKHFLEEIPDNQIRRKIYRHVFAGGLNVMHGMLFFREHIIHHEPQIKRLIRASQTQSKPVWN